MFVVQENDLSSMDDFPLRWRWTDRKYNLLSDVEIEQIRPLRHDKAAELDAITRGLFGGPDPRIVGDTGSALRSLAATHGAVSFDTSGDALEGRTWLERTLPASDCDVFVSWNKDTAVLTRMSIFVQYWDDFCYPSSDDVAVLPVARDRILYYWHEEVLTFCFV